MLSHSRRSASRQSRQARGRLARLTWGEAADRVWELQARSVSLCCKHIRGTVFSRMSAREEVKTRPHDNARSM